MAQSHVPLKDPVFSAVLAFLIPGLGHFYQRRLFKGLLYSVCILGTFFTGMQIGHGQVVYFNWHSPENRTYAYLCQFWAGLPAVPALAQSHFRSPQAFAPNYVPSHFEASFEGTLTDEDGTVGSLKGRLDLQPQQPDQPRNWSGKFQGAWSTPRGEVTIEGQITSGDLEPQVAASPRRRLSGRFEGNVVGQARTALRGALAGAMRRPLWDYYQAPLQDSHANDAAGDQSELDAAHRKLGSRFELGVVYTMIAGLLNILAIYDALEGPAYEDEEEDEPKKDLAPPQPASA
ncbi:MAG: DUF6677 family protein [Planctomycetaceae bacterium]